MNSTQHWKKDKKRHRQEFKAFSIRGASAGKPKSRVLEKRSYKYWRYSVRRLNIFLDLWGKDKLPVGYVINGQIDRATRLILKIALKEYLLPYEGETDEKYRPFSVQQESELWHAISGGLLIEKLD